MKSICSDCVLIHKNHECFSYKESSEHCASSFQQLQDKIETHKQAVEQSANAEKLAAQAQVEQCKRKVQDAVNKIRQAVTLLNSTADSLEKIAQDCPQIIITALKTADLTDLLQRTADLSVDAAKIEKTTALGAKFKAVQNLAQKLQNQPTVVPKVNVAAVQVLFSDSELSKTLDSLVETAKQLKLNVTNNVKHFLSVTHLKEDLRQAVQAMSNRAAPINQVSLCFCECCTLALTSEEYVVRPKFEMGHFFHTIQSNPFAV
jgi:selenocysteine lyase/cysteine desulfurase